MENSRRQLLGGWLALGTGLTIVFYAIAGMDAFQGTALRRYTMEHWVEYATIFLFACGFSDLLLKYVEIRRQRAALERDWLPSASDPQPVTTAVELFGRVTAVPAPVRDTLAGARLRDGLHYVREKRSADGLEDHLRHLSDLDADQSHAGFALVRLITWAIPILGFLGTVLGITIAVSNVTPQQLETSLSEVTNGLGVAFDTTALGLVLSMLLMGINYLVERAEYRLLRQVDDLASDSLLHRFVGGDATSAPFLSVIQHSTEMVVGHTQKLVQQQVDLWSLTLNALQQQHQEWTKQQEARFARMLETLRGEGERQVAGLGRTAIQMDSLQHGLKDVVKVLAELSAGEQRLAGMQQRLAENLELLNRTQGFDQAVQSLTAAIHLLTLRHQLTPTEKKVA